MKEKWTTPKTVIEEFTPSNYCAICWAVGCQRGKENYVESAYPNVSHSEDNCGLDANQAIRELANGSIMMVELNTGQGTLACQDVQPYPLTWENIQKNGNKVSWNTYSKNDSRIWHHYGYAYKDTTTSNAS